MSLSSAGAPLGRTFIALGNRPSQEDRFVVWEGVLASHARLSVYAVFDGHNGALSATTCRAHLMPLILRHATWRAARPDVAAVLRDVVASLEARVLAATRADRTFDGTTLCVAVVYDGTLHVANVGDSRAVLVGRRVEQLTVDHKVSEAGERRRLAAAGAVLRRNRMLGVQKDLEISRALGDREFKEKGAAAGRTLIAVPDVVSRRLGGDDVGLLMATDGLWDIAFLGNDELGRMAVKLLHEGTRVAVAAERIVREALRFRASDNVTLVLVKLRAERRDGEREGGGEVSQEGEPDVGEGAKCLYWEASRMPRATAKSLVRSVTNALHRRLPREKR